MCSWISVGEDLFFIFFNLCSAAAISALPRVKAVALRRNFFYLSIYIYISLSFTFCRLYFWTKKNLLFLSKEALIAKIEAIGKVEELVFKKIESLDWLIIYYFVFNRSWCQWKQPKDYDVAFELPDVDALNIPIIQVRS